MQQITSNIIMIRPAHFGFNEETADNNAFQTNDQSLSVDEISKIAVAEFDAFVAELRSKSINVQVIQDTDAPRKPDAIFPNNWISLHEEGTVVLYPMYAVARRLERRKDIVELIKNEYKVDKEYTFEHYEEEDTFLEGTGSLILDRENKIAYANLSPRTDLRLFDKWCILMGYDKVYFFAKDQNGTDIYHTNVIMALGETFCVICLESLPDEGQKEVVKTMLTKTGKDIIEISFEQVNSFAGNMLQVKSKLGNRFLVMSSTAYQSLNQNQIETLQKHTDFIIGHIPTIEKYGGGSVRCMMAENFLKVKN